MNMTTAYELLTKASDEIVLSRNSKLAKLEKQRKAIKQEAGTNWQSALAQYGQQLVQETITLGEAVVEKLRREGDLCTLVGIHKPYDPAGQCPFRSEDDYLAADGFVYVVTLPKNTELKPGLFCYETFPDFVRFFRENSDGQGDTLLPSIIPLYGLLERYIRGESTKVDSKILSVMRRKLKAKKKEE